MVQNRAVNKPSEPAILARSSELYGLKWEGNHALLFLAPDLEQLLSTPGSANLFLTLRGSRHQYFPQVVPMGSQG